MYAYLVGFYPTRKITRGDLLELLWTICIHGSGGGWDWDRQQLLAVPSGKRHFSFLLYSMGNMWLFLLSLASWKVVHLREDKKVFLPLPTWLFNNLQSCRVWCKIYFKHISFTYRAGQFVWNHRQRVLVWRWAAKRAMIFENVEICAGDDVANALVCNYNPYFMSLYEWCALRVNLVQIW